MLLRLGAAQVGDLQPRAAAVEPPAPCRDTHAQPRAAGGPGSPWDTAAARLGCAQRELTLCAQSDGSAWRHSSNTTLPITKLFRQTPAFPLLPAALLPKNSSTAIKCLCLVTFLAWKEIVFSLSALLHLAR